MLPVLFGSALAGIGLLAASEDKAPSKTPATGGPLGGALSPVGDNDQRPLTVRLADLERRIQALLARGIRTPEDKALLAKRMARRDKFIARIARGDEYGALGSASLAAEEAYGLSRAEMIEEFAALEEEYGFDEDDEYGDDEDDEYGFGITRAEMLNRYGALEDVDLFGALDSASLFDEEEYGEDEDDEDDEFGAFWHSKAKRAEIKRKKARRKMQKAKKDRSRLRGRAKELDDDDDDESEGRGSGGSKRSRGPFKRKPKILRKEGSGKHGSKELRERSKKIIEDAKVAIGRKNWNQVKRLGNRMARLKKEIGKRRGSIHWGDEAAVLVLFAQGSKKRKDVRQAFGL